MIKQRYFAGRVLVYGLISVTVMLSAAMTGCNNKNNISEGSIKTEGSTKTEGNNQSEEFSETDVNDQPSDIHVEPPVIHGISDKTYYIGSKVSYMTDVYATDFSGQEIDVEVDKSQVNTSQPGSYIVYYKAVDSDGNETIEEVTFTFIEEETQEVKVNSSYSTLDEVVPYLPENKPTYLMGVGTPANIIEAVDRGIDFFDCVYPSRNGRHGHVYTHHGKLNLFNKKFELDPRPIEEGCQCPACRTYSRAYIRHLLKAKEMLGMRLCVLHNLYFYNHLMEEIRGAIDEHRYKEFKKTTLEGFLTPEEEYR